MKEVNKALVDVIRAIMPLYFKRGVIDIKTHHRGVVVSCSAELGSFQVNGRIYYSSERFDEMNAEEVNSAITRRLKWNLVEEIWRKFPEADAYYVSKELVF